MLKVHIMVSLRVYGACLLHTLYVTNANYSWDGRNQRFRLFNYLGAAGKDARGIYAVRRGCSTSFRWPFQPNRGVPPPPRSAMIVLLLYGRV